MSESAILKLFSRYQDGDIDAIVEIVEYERAQIFDYLIRLTGQHDSALATIDEVVRALKNSDLDHSFESYNDLRVKVFSTARNFSRHIWNADITALENQGLGGADSDDGKRRLMQLEAALARLPGIDRELVLLNCRYGFFTSETAAILNMSGESCSDRITMVLHELTKDMPGSEGSMKELVGSLLLHPITGNANTGTVALSQIMGDIGKVRRGWGYYRNLILIFLTLAVFGLLYYFYL